MPTDMVETHTFEPTPKRDLRRYAAVDAMDKVIAGHQYLNETETMAMYLLFKKKVEKMIAKKAKHDLL